MNFADTHLPVLPIFETAFAAGHAHYLARYNGNAELAKKEATEDALRQQLSAMGLPYRTLHSASLLNVLHPPSAQQSPESTARANSQWQRWLQRGCEECSDPVCEHRLFQDLIEHRTTQRGG